MPKPQPSGKNRRRRTHKLGGCRTCRRRHVKCDQVRPVCLTCRAVGISCEGFSTEIRWMSSTKHQPQEQLVSLDDNDEAGGMLVANDGARSHLYTEQSRASMGATLATGLASGSVDASLAEIEAKSKDARWSSTGDIVIGPFGVLNFDSSTNKDDIQHTHDKMRSIADNRVPPAGDLPPVDASLSSQEVGSLFNPDEFLHWADLFALESDLMGTTLQGPWCALDDNNFASRDVIFDGGTCTNKPQQRSDALANEDCGEQHDARQMITPQQSPADSTISSLDVLPDAPFLLKHLQDNVIAQMMCLPIGQKSPWSIINIPAAVLTLSDLTFLGEQNLNYARLANFYSLLACSAYHLAANPAFDSVNSSQHWTRVTRQTHSQAKDYIQQSLKTEGQDLPKAKYKDQLMATSGMTVFAILSGNQKDARRYLIDSERLLRVRGLAKREISRKARLLHHAYSWARIVSESTYVLHDYIPSDSFTEALNRHFRDAYGSENDQLQRNERNNRLDDFLRLQPRHSDSDLDIDEPKGHEVGLHDIHLEDSRRFPGTLYSQIYGIPETWIGLVSQTTRLANVMETLMINSGSAKKRLSPETWEALQRRSSILENMVCSLNLRSGKTGSVDSVDTPEKPHAHMLRALNAALVIFFYRRIRQVNPSILQGLVDDVIGALHDFDKALSQFSVAGPGIAWPAFIAGCEAIAPSRRDALLRWIENGVTQCGFATFKVAKEVMTEVWKEQDEHLTANRRSGTIPTWVHVVKQKRLWPMFC